VTRRVDVALAWTLLAAFGFLARSRGGPARALLLAALRQASRPPCRPTGEPARGAVAVVAAFRRVSGGHPLARSCVPRALALRHLLVLRGFPARVRLGLGPGRRLEGHAWVECGGVPLGEASSIVARYRPCETS
jgi:hypothetical protein